MDPNVVQGIVYYLISHSDRFKLEFLPLTQQKDKLLRDDPLFSEDIKRQYNSMLTSKIVDDMVKAIGVTTEQALMVVEDMDLDQYLR